MKIFYFLLCSVSMMLLSCNNEGQSCDSIYNGLLDKDKSAVKGELDKWLSKLHPDTNSEDPIGHEQNLQTFLHRLQNDCAMEAMLICYACIETYPPQSEISIELDSAGQKVQRVLDIRTPSDDEMTVTGIHE